MVLTLYASNVASVVLEKVTAQTEDLSKSLAEHFICYLGLADVMNKIG